MTDTGTAEPRRRLHPLTPLLRSFRMAAVVAAALSWQGYDQLGTAGFAIALLGVLVVVGLGSVVSWLVTGYHVVDRELRVYEGLLSRRTRSIPVERLQSVEVVRSPLARLVGLAELRLEVVGAASTEAPLAFLTVAEATALRTRLLGLASSPQAGGGPLMGGDGPTGLEGGQFAGTEVAAPAEQVLHRVADRDLIISQLRRPHWWSLPFAVAMPIVFIRFGGDATFISIASTATATFGILWAPVRTVLADWHFTVATAPDGLRVRRGALETRNQTVPRGRVQAIGVQWPLLWRSRGWVRATIDVAGVVTGGEDSPGRGTLLPVGTVPVARLLFAEALAGFDLTEVVVVRVPDRARWLAPLRRRVLGYALTPTAFATQSGVITRHLTIAPYARIQSVRVTQGPLQRRLGLATVHADTAQGGLYATAEHRDAAEAHALALELARRSRAAREQPAAGQAPIAW